MEAEAAPDRTAVLHDVLALGNADAPAIDDVERVLADGYACALQLEAEGLRLRRRLERRAADLGASPAPDAVAEVTELGSRIARADAELAVLREALARLRQTARRVRD